MSTRCNVIIRDTKFGKPNEVIFYRHSDGYPSGVGKTLNEFISWVQNNRIRDNVSQAAGWLIMLGNEEAADMTLAEVRKNTKTNLLFKVGSYEPATRLSDDIEYLYEIDLTAKTLRGWEYDGKKGDEVTQDLHAATRRPGRM